MTADARAKTTAGIAETTTVDMTANTTTNMKVSTATRSDFDFFQPFRVRYSEIDYQGIVFNAHYLTYYDVTITEYLREIGFDYDNLTQTANLDFHLVRSLVEYKQPIVKDAEIEVGIVCGRIGTSSVTWSLAIFGKRDNEVLATGEIVWVCSVVGEHKSHPLPQGLIDLLSARNAARVGQ
jgi:acyl-CoA thioester hydrolase